MEQRTCNIIMCCKGHCKLPDAGEASMEAIAAYMSKECLCPKEDYKGSLDRKSTRLNSSHIH